MKRITYLFTALAAAAATATAFAAKPQTPNIVMVICDDLTMQAVSAYRHPLKLLQTPNLDRLAREGVLFERCLVPNSICGPSRAAILTGKYSHLNGFYNNATLKDFDGSQPTFPKMLHGTGYQTAMIGKWHFNSAPTGFDLWQMYPGQGIYYNAPMIKNGVKVATEGYTTDVITDLALDWLKARDGARPFFLLLGHKAPHRDWSPALRHLGWNKDKPFPEPDTLFDDFSGRGRAEHEQAMSLEMAYNARDSKEVAPVSLNAEQRKVWDAYYEPRNAILREGSLKGRELIRWRYQRYMHDYLGTVMAVDENLGRVLKYLDDERIAQNTLVLFTSDQGFFLGEHGWFDKRWIYEESVTAPLLMRWPGVAKPGVRHPAMVSVLDIPETFLEAAGVPVPADMQGRSLVPLLAGRTPPDWRTSFYYHYYEYPGPHLVRKHYGVVTGRYKLFHFYEPDVNQWTLMDRERDPKELKNVYDDPAYAEARRVLHAELKRLRTELKVPDEDPPGSIIPDQLARRALDSEGKNRSTAKGAAR